MRTHTQLVVALGLASLAFAKPPVPRAAKDLTITEPSGKTVEISKYKGKVVLVQFLYTNCQHCQATARMLTKIQADLGTQGLQIVGAAFNEDAQVREFVDQNHVGFPVGEISRDTALATLEIPVMARFVVPQIMIVDRKGVIRAQSDFLGSPELQNEEYLRTFLKGLLEELRAVETSRR